MPSKQRKSSDFDMHYYLRPGSPLKEKKGENQTSWLLSTNRAAGQAIKVYKTFQISAIVYSNDSV